MRDMFVGWVEFGERINKYDELFMDLHIQIAP